MKPGDTAANLRPLAEQALSARFRELHPDVPLDQNNRLADLKPLILDTISDHSLEAALRDVAQGDGHELDWEHNGRLPPRLHSVYSSCGLALNSFGPWRIEPRSATVITMSGFSELRFEQRLRVFPRGGRAPNLDAVFCDEQRVLAIESKLCEHLAPARPVAFETSYARPMATAHENWRSLYLELKERPDGFLYLGVGQLIRHYLGLRAQIAAGGIHASRTATLAYVYWEPIDAEHHSPCMTHRHEVAEFTNRVSDSDVAFQAVPHHELWRAWEAEAYESLASSHARLLRDRYEVSLR